jgi:hypothetical protein
MWLDRACLRHSLRGFASGVLVLWAVGFCMSGFSFVNATFLFLLFLGSPFIRLYHGGFWSCLEVGVLLAVTAGLLWLVLRFSHGILLVLLCATLVVLYGFYGAYSLSLFALA